MSKQNFRQQIKQIFDHYNKKVITREEFLSYLQSQGYSHEEAIEIYNRAAREKIIEAGLVTDLDERGLPTKRKILVEYMTEEDWKAIEELEKVIEEGEEMKRILRGED